MFSSRLLFRITHFGIIAGEGEIYYDSYQLEKIAKLLWRVSFISEGVGSGGGGLLPAGGVPTEYFEVAAGFGPGEQGAEKFADAGSLAPLAAA